MGSLERPKLRPLSAQRLERGGQVYACLEDPLGVFVSPYLLPLDGYQRVVRHFDGSSTLSDIQSRIRRESGQNLPSEELEELVAKLDRAMVLDGPTYESFRDEYAQQSVRRPVFAGRSYAATESSLRTQIDDLYRHHNGSGVPVEKSRRDQSLLRGVVCPHIDFERGGPVYTWAYRELAEQAPADVYVILGVAHQYCSNRFALTRKHFDTPLGLVETDQEYVQRIAELAGSHLFGDELCHRTEHSIEFQTVFLKHLLGSKMNAKIVPILVGSFHDLMVDGSDPINCREVGRFVAALRKTEAESGKRVVYIGGIDLCHVGPEFGDAGLVDRATIRTVEQFDKAMLDRAAANDPVGWFRTAAEIGNRWRVCGLAATYTMLQAIGPSRGRLLKYGQTVNDQRTCFVSFASLAFEVDPSSQAERCSAVEKLV